MSSEHFENQPQSDQMVASVNCIEVGIVVQMVIQSEYIGHKCIANVECHVYENRYHHHLQR